LLHGLLSKSIDVHPTSTFNEIGGDSFIAAKFISTLRSTYGIEINAKDLFEYPLEHFDYLITETEKKWGF